MNLYFRRYGTARASPPADPEPSGGAPLIILHGLFGSLNNWDTLSRRWGKEFAVYAVDQRNHGRSPHHPVHTYPALAGDIREFMDQQGLSEAHILGHSMGGKTAMELALSSPRRVRSLIVVDIAPVAYPPSRDPLVGALSAVPLATLSSRQQADAALQAAVPDLRTRQFLLTNLRRTDAGRLEWKMNLGALRDNLPAINGALAGDRVYDGPVLLIRGANSPYVPPEHESMLHSVFPNVRIATIPAAGHWVHADAPDAVFETVRAFLHSC